MAGQRITFYLVRHGEAECNAKNILSSSLENDVYGLTAEGKRVVAATAGQLASESIDAIISSPFRRTRETAEMIAATTGVPVDIDKRLRESGLGVFDGGPHSALVQKYPDPAMRVAPDPDDDVESYPEMRKRLHSFLDDIKERYAGKSVVVVSHGDPLEQLHGILTEESPGVSAVGWYPEKGLVTKIEWQVS